jgi:mannan endo-1,4-beta-mannosidase
VTSSRLRSATGLLLRVLMPILVVVACSAPAEAGRPPGFVYREGTALMLDGRPYRFVGVNNFDLTGCHTGTPVASADTDAFFASLPPVSMVRVWAFERWGIAPIEETVRLAEKHGQKLTLVLIDGNATCDVPALGPDWYRQGFRGAYFDWIKRLATEFRDSPAVAIWELIGEGGLDSLSTDEVKQFYDESAAQIKQVDPKHLVSTGALAPWESFQFGEAGYAYVHSGLNIDLLGVHEYDFGYSNGQTVISPQFFTARDAAQALGKPIYVGETGVGLKSGCMTAEERAAVLRKKFDAYLASDAAGVLYWDVLGPPNNPGTECNSQYNHDPMLGGPVMDMISKYWQGRQR